MTIVQNRRDFIGITAGVALAAGASGALAQGVPPKTEYAVKKLPFDPAKIKGLSEKLLVFSSILEKIFGVERGKR